MPRVSLAIPKYDSDIAALAPKTPADEGLDFFEAGIKHGEEPIRVYELQLDPDGGPNKERAVSTPSRSRSRRAMLSVRDDL